MYKGEPSSELGSVSSNRNATNQIRDMHMCELKCPTKTYILYSSECYNFLLNGQVFSAQSIGTASE